MVIGVAQNAPLLQLPSEVHVRPCDIVAICPFTSTCFMMPCFTERRPSHNLYIHRELHLLVTVARNSSAHSQISLHMLKVPNSQVEILNILKFP